MKRELGLIEVFCISSGAMISSGLFILPGVAYGQAGPSVLIAYILASILAVPTILAKAELSTAMPKTGGIFFFTDRSMGPMMGVLGGMTAWFSLALKSAFALFGLGIFATILEPSLGTLEVKLIAIAFCLLFMTLNICGTKLSAKFQVGMVISLITLLALYVAAGLFFLTPGNYTPFFSEGISPILKTTGLVFVSFAGSTKVAAVAGEVRKPGRNIPLGMFLSWFIVSLLYIAVIAVTIGLVKPSILSGNETPISEGGGIILGGVGIFVMSIAGILAFVSTGNAGIMAASRDPMAMGKDHLLPRIFNKRSRWGTPWFSIIITTAFMITMIAVTDVKQLAGYASTLKLLLFILACLALIFMRESNLKHYRPKYRAPLYPWAQIIGISAYALIIIMLGMEKLLVGAAFIGVGILWYFIYAHGTIKREYALLHVAEKVMGEEKTEYLLDEELREILISRDRIKRTRLIETIDNSMVIDMKGLPPPDKLARKLAYSFSERHDFSEKELINEVTKEDRKAHMMMMEDSVILSYQVKGRDIYDMALIRIKKGAIFSKDSPPVHATFVILFSKDERNFYLNSLMWLMDSCQGEDFKREWRSARKVKELKKVLTSRISDHSRKKENG
ncbi:MAG: amino acid permease [Candidatus Thermoplasmatota archaeon]|nr:amino acid permease [Candidatus Thermoplasmatota archaeon]